MGNTREKYGKMLEKSKDENVLKKYFESPHVDKGVRQLLRSKKKKNNL